MVVKVENRERIKRFLDAKPVNYAIVIHRVTDEASGWNDVFVDSIENPGAVMTVSKSEDRHIAIAGDDKQAIRELLKTVPDKCFFFGVEDHIVEIIKEMFTTDYMEPCWLYSLDRPVESADHKYKVEYLKVGDAETVDKYWDLVDDAAEMLREKIEKYETAAVRINGELVSWAGNHFETDKACQMGFMYTMEQYRRKGIAREVAAVLIRRIQEKGLVPYCYMFKTNTPSVKFVESMGFERTGNGTWVEVIGRK